jgi:hypothetical protein
LLGLVKNVFAKTNRIRAEMSPPPGRQNQPAAAGLRLS